MLDAIPPIDAWVSGSGTSEALGGPIPWNAPSSEARLLRRLQARRRGETGGRLWKSAEVDHRIPLFRVWSEHRGRAMAAVAGLLGLAKFGVGAVTYAEPQNPAFGRRDRHRGTFGRKERHAVKAYRVDRTAGAVARCDDRCRANPASGSAAGAKSEPEQFTRPTGAARSSGIPGDARYVAWVNGTRRRRCRRNLCNPADGGFSSPSSAPALFKVAHGGR